MQCLLFRCITGDSQSAECSLLPKAREGYVFRRVCLSTVREGLGQTAPSRQTQEGLADPLGRIPLGKSPSRQTHSRQTFLGKTPGRPLLLTSSGGHCSGRYASYWNACLVGIVWVIFCCNKKDCIGMTIEFSLNSDS